MVQGGDRNHAEKNKQTCERNPSTSSNHHSMTEFFSVPKKLGCVWIRCFKRSIQHSMLHEKKSTCYMSVPKCVCLFAKFSKCNQQTICKKIKAIQVLPFGLNFNHTSLGAPDLCVGHRVQDLQRNRPLDTSKSRPGVVDAEEPRVETPTQATKFTKGKDMDQTYIQKQFVSQNLRFCQKHVLLHVLQYMPT